jgi:hypothetical protein
MLVSAARAEMERGAMRIVVDMTGTESISLAGAIGLYLVAELSNGESSQVAAITEGISVDQVDGWTLINQMREALQKGKLYSRMLVVTCSKAVLQSMRDLGLNGIIRTAPSLDVTLQPWQLNLGPVA